MISQNHHRRPRSHSAISAGILFSACVLVAAEDAEIFVHAGAHHTWQGFGGSAYTDAAWNSFSEDNRMGMVNLAYGDLDFHFIRLWAGVGTTVADIVNEYGQYVKDVKKVQPDVKLLLGPCANVSGQHMGYPLADYAKHYADMIKGLKQNHDMDITVTGIMNEPNAFGRLYPNEVPQLVKLFRQELDARGLENVKIIAPECSMVDDGCEDMIDALIADKDALDVLDGFSTHCYGMCLRHYIVEKEWPCKKEHWQTESSSTGFKTAALVLSDMNLGTTHWTHFFAFFDQNGDAERFAVIGYTKPSGSYVIYPQFYFYKQLLPTFPIGTVMRFCESNVESWDGERFEYMENTYGDKPPLCAASGVTPDRHLSLAVVNNSEACPDTGCWDGAKWYPPTEFNIEFVVEELVDKGGNDEMVMHRVTNTTKGADSVGIAVLDNGYVGITVKPGEMITLKSLEPVDMSGQDGAGEFEAGSIPARAHLSVRCSAARRVEIFFAVPQTSGVSEEPVKISVHATDGRQIKALPMARIGASRHTVAFDASDIASGLYVVRLTATSGSRSARFFIR